MSPTRGHGGSQIDVNHGARDNEEADRHSSQDMTDPGHGNTSDATRNGSAATAIEDDSSAAKMDSIDEINTVTKEDNINTDDRNLGIRDTFRGATQSAKRRIYLHHRNKKDLNKQFSPGSVAKHLKLKEKESHDPEAQIDPEEIQHPTAWQNIKIMCTTFPYWNMAFWSGWCYSIGSAMFVVDGAWSWTPLQWPESEFKGESKYGVPLLFFFGACLYQVGGVMAYLEAINDGSFAGAAMKRLLDGHQDVEKELLDAKLHTFFGHIVPHHHHEDEDKAEERQRQTSENPENGWKSLSKKNSPEEVYAEAKERVERRGGIDQGPPKEGVVREYIAWRWWPTQRALRTYHIFELGYLACAIQLFGVTLYGVTSVVILPGILSSLEWWQELGAYWVPQVVASVCFLTASVMFTVMAQDKWWKPKVNAVSWWIGIHAQIGSVGFLLCAIFGLLSNDHEWAEYQSSLSSMWGSFFYMLSGLFQWYEAININVGPVLAFPNNRTPVLLRKNEPVVGKEEA